MGTKPESTPKINVIYGPRFAEQKKQALKTIANYIKTGRLSK